MTKRIYGTNPWVAGEKLYAADLNDTIINTSTGHIHDGVDSAPIFLTGIPQMAFQQLQATTFVNQDNLSAEYFNIASGKNSTYISGTAIYDTVNYAYVSQPATSDLAPADTTSYTTNNGGWANPDNAFDGDDSSYAEATFAYNDGLYGHSLGKTFSSKYINSVRVKFYYSVGGGTQVAFILETYNGSTWSQAYYYGAWGYGDTGTQDITIYLLKSVQGIRLRASRTAGVQPSVVRLYTMNYYNNAASSTVTVNPYLTLDNTEKAIVLYGRKSTPTNTAITVNITDGSTTLSNKSLNSTIDISSLSSGSLGLTFNLTTSDPTVTPLLYGYGVYLFK